MADLNIYNERYISGTDGLRVFARDYPAPSIDHAKPTVVCLAGLTRNSQDFDVVAAYIQQTGHRVVTIDYRGRGLSEFDKNPANYHPATYVSDIFHVLCVLGVHEAVFVGTSLGGLLSMGLCAMAPGLVKAVVLNDVGPDLNENGLEKIVAYTSDGRSVGDLDGAVEKLKSYYAQEAGMTARDWAEIAKRTYKLQDGQYVPNWDTNIADNLKTRATSEQKEDLWRYFYALADRSVLVFRGELSSVFEKNTYDKMLESLPNIKGLSVPDVGHAPTMEEPAVRQALLEFLSEVAAK